MGTQKQTEMAHKEIRDERTGRPTEDITEEQFLKELYLFMKKRDTPIERIPHLGFKQIDLFVMFKTVKELGGYHQVTAQQLWKQVYNTLGGNPRSTSAATCTRRHYEKLLLPYECHIKGVQLNAVPQPKNFHYLNYRKEDDDCQIPAKRRPFPFSLPSLPGGTSEQPVGVFPQSHSYHKFYYPHYSLQGPYAPLSHSLLPSPHPPAPPQPYLACPPPTPNSTDPMKDPLEHLRYLAKQYETSAGFAEPLNLSIKASSHHISTNPVSSFAPPSANKKTKFLNKAPPLYTSENASVKSVSGSVADTSFFNGLKASGEDSPSHDSVTAMSPEADSASSQNNTEESEETTKNTSSKTQERDCSPEDTGMYDLLSSSTRENGGRMEIEIPLSVFNNWLQMYGPLATKQLLIPQVKPGQSSGTETLPTKMMSEVKPREIGMRQVEENVSLRRRNMPNHYTANQYHFNSYKPLPSCGILKNAAGREVYPYDQPDEHKRYSPKPVTPDCWEATNRADQTLPIQVNINSSPLTLQQDFRASKPQAVPMLNSSSSSVLQLTPEEVMKLKKIISNSA